MHSLNSEHLSHRFGYHVLFQGLQLKVRGGEVLAVTGANGTGKTTLLKILAGVLRPTKGAVVLHVGNTRISKEDHPLHVGFVAPYINTYENLTAKENLEFVSRIRGLPHADEDENVRKALETTHLTAYANERVHTLSSGMRQRMKIAVAILALPPVLILDEPMVTMDAQGQALCADVVADTTRRGGLVVIASNMTRDYAAADQLICVEDYARK